MLRYSLIFALLIWPSQGLANNGFSQLNEWESLGKKGFTFSEDQIYRDFKINKVAFRDQYSKGKTPKIDIEITAPRDVNCLVWFRAEYVKNGFKVSDRLVMRWGDIQDINKDPIRWLASLGTKEMSFQFPHADNKAYLFIVFLVPDGGNGCRDAGSRINEVTAHLYQHGGVHVVNPHYGDLYWADLRFPEPLLP